LYLSFNIYGYLVTVDKYYMKIISSHKIRIDVATQDRIFLRNPVESHVLFIIERLIIHFIRLDSPIKWLRCGTPGVKSVEKKPLGRSECRPIESFSKSRTERSGKILLRKINK
jgi:hypothetical protein